MFNQHVPIILASSSPRRKSMLQELGLQFKTTPAHIDETPLACESPEHFACRMATEKADVIADSHPESVVIAADTVVAMDGRIFGKPTSPENALEILKSLRNNTHTVITGVAVIWKQGSVTKSFTTRTTVTFGDFNDAVLAAYVNSNDPMDKAGAYGIQASGGFLVKSIEGSYSNVVGLPICELITLLLRHKVVTGI